MSSLARPRLASPSARDRGSGARRAAGSSTLAPDPSRAALDEVAAAVIVALRRRGLARSLAVARVLVDSLYGGDPNGFRSREGKAVSLRRLADHGVPISAAALYRCLSVHEIWLRARGRRWPALVASHYRAVESLMPDSQSSWLARAAEQGWSATRLRDAIRASGAPTAHRGGRLPRHPVARFVTRVERELAALRGVGSQLEVHANECGPMSQLVVRLEAAAQQCRHLAARLRAAVQVHEARPSSDTDDEARSPSAPRR